MKRTFDPNTVYVCRVNDIGPRGGKCIRWWAITGDAKFSGKFKTMNEMILAVAEHYHPGVPARWCRYENSDPAPMAMTFAEIKMEQRANVRRLRAELRECPRVQQYETGGEPPER